MAEAAVRATLGVARHAKRRVALLLSYDGTGYNGSQFNPGFPTIDCSIVEAISKIEGVIDERNLVSPAKLGWNRASRTDAGVHAIGNLISCKLRIDPSWISPVGDAPGLVTNINGHLPSHIRVLNACVVPRGFSARSSTQSRAYHYWLPVAALLRRPLLQQHARINVQTEEEEEEAALRSFRGIFGEYARTHNWHNFTLPRVRKAYVKPLNPAYDWDTPPLLPKCDADPSAARELDVSAAVAAGGDGASRGAAIDGEESEDEWEEVITGPISRDFHGAFSRFHSLVNGAPAADPGARPPRPGDRARLPPSDSFAWRYAPQVIRAVYHADVSEPFELVQETDANTASRPLLRLEGTCHALDLGFDYLRDGAEVSRSSKDDVKPQKDEQGGGSNSTLNRQALGRLVRLTVHGSGFMPRQIRHMVGAALAVHHGALAADVLRAAFVLPVLPPLPMAPPGGLVQAEIHMAAMSCVSWMAPAPRPSQIKRSHQSIRPDVISLLPNVAKVSRARFFDDVLLPRLASFCGAVVSNEAAQAVVARETPCSAPSYVKADNIPLLEWLEKLPNIAMSASDQARVLQCYAAMKPSYERGVMVRTASTRTVCAAAAENLWTREDLALPSLTCPINVSHGSRDDVVGAATAYAHWQRKNIAALLAAPTRVRDLYLGSTPVGIVADACSSDACSVPSPPFSGSLRWAALREIYADVLPRGLYFALVSMRRLAFQGDVEDVARAIAFRVARGEWPPVAPPELHATWASEIGTHELGREGRLLAVLEREEESRSAAYLAFVRAARKPRVVVPVTAATPLSS